MVGCKHLIATRGRFTSNVFHFSSNSLCALMRLVAKKTAAVNRYGVIELLSVTQYRSWHRKRRNLHCQ